MSLEIALTNTQKTVPECLAVGLVDMKTGMLLGIRTVENYSNDVLDLVAAATGDLFQGSNVTMIEQVFRKHRQQKEDGHHYFQEIVILSDNNIHFFQRCKRNEDMVLVTVSRISANLGMVIAKARAGLAGVEAAV
jgi:hypothetical protein